MKIPGEPGVFFERLAQIVANEKWKEWEQESFENQPNRPSGSKLNLIYTKSRIGIPKGLLVQFLHISAYDRDRLRVEIRSSTHSWTYESYVATARLAQPLLSKYNKKYHSRIRLAIQSKENLIPKLPPTLLSSFDLFVSMANKSGLHPLDWGRFYTFIWAAHESRAKTTDEDVAILLERDGFTENYARQIAAIYYHGRRLLSPKYH